VRRPILLLAAVAVLAGCATRVIHPAPAILSTPSTRVTPPPTKIVTRTGPCTLLSHDDAAGAVGMRIDRIQGLYVGRAEVGCRYYATQDPSFNASEHLPGPNQPILEFVATKYASTAVAHAAMVGIAEHGHGAYAANLSSTVEGASFQTTFYPVDHGKDWAYIFRTGRTVVLVKTVQTDSSLDARAVAAAIVGKFG
jgi:hypothetical protein